MRNLMGRVLLSFLTTNWLAVPEFAVLRSANPSSVAPTFTKIL